ncbi:MAG TPA: NAD(P)-dependent oxidoreductase [Edaphobacter sp.]|nr:NAD(P)-dependent oxidoreductase [Edaphobacter sp.]
MKKPVVAVLAGEELFASFFDRRRRARLSRISRWTLCPIQTCDPGAISPLAEADALITTWDSPYLSTETMKQLPSVRIVAHCGGEVKKRFDRSLFRKLVIVNTPTPMAKPTAEMGAAFLLYAARNIDHYRDALRKRSNQIYKDVHLTGGGTESLLGSEVGMIGFGRVGRSLVEMLRGFDVRWRVYDPFASRKLAAGLPVKFDSLNAVLKRSSLLMVTAAATEKTRNLLNRERLGLLPNGATVINIARGSLIDLAALTEEVKSGRLRCALDVTDPEEPLPVSHPLRTFPGAIVTPHLGGGGQRTRGEMADAAMDELCRFFSGEAVEHRVTPSMLSRMT